MQLNSKRHVYKIPGILGLQRKWHEALQYQRYFKTISEAHLPPKMNLMISNYHIRQTKHACVTKLSSYKQVKSMGNNGEHACLVSALLCKVEQQDKTSDNKIGKHIN